MVPQLAVLFLQRVLQATTVNNTYLWLYSFKHWRVHQCNLTLQQKLKKNSYKFTDTRASPGSLQWRQKIEMLPTLQVVGTRSS